MVTVWIAGGYLLTYNIYNEKFFNGFHFLGPDSIKCGTSVPG